MWKSGGVSCRSSVLYGCLRTALPAAVSYEYQSSSLLSGSDGVRASEGFLCAVAATEPTGCALPEGPGRARWQARERSERVEAMHFRHCAGRRGAGTMTRNVRLEM